MWETRNHAAEIIEKTHNNRETGESFLDEINIFCLKTPKGKNYNFPLFVVLFSKSLLSAREWRCNLKTHNYVNGLNYGEIT